MSSSESGIPTTVEAERSDYAGAIIDHLDLWTSAVTKKSTTGRGSNGKIELTGIKKLRELILDLAVRGKLLPQDSNDEPASLLLKKIAAERDRIAKKSNFKVTKANEIGLSLSTTFKIPSNWKWCLLDNISVIARGGSPRPIKDYITNDAKGLNWIKIGDAKKGSLYIDRTNEKIRPEGLKKTRKVYPGDLILSNSMSFGQPYIMSIDGCIHDGWLLIRTPDELISKIFLYYLFLSNHSAKSFRDAAAGAVVQNLNADKVRLLSVPLPPLAEQHRIVQKIDELMALCDKLEQQASDQLAAHETLVDTLLDTLTNSADATELAGNWACIQYHFDTLFTTEHSIDRLKQTILQLAVMGKLVPQDANDEPASVLLEKIAVEKERLVNEGKIKKPKALLQISEEEKLFAVPKGWEWIRCGDLTTKITDGEHSTPKRSSNGKYLLSARNVTNEGILLSDVDYVPDFEFERIRKRCDPNKGDILISCSGSVGRAALVDRDNTYSMVRSAAMIRPAKYHFNLKFLLYSLHSPYLQSQIVANSRQSAQANLFLGAIAKLVFLVPPFEEQNRIVQKVDELMALCDKLKTRLNKASKIQQQLAKAVVTVKTDVA
ncbi:MAG: restriction endonuclease subunit S [Balneolales bacterium]